MSAINQSAIREHLWPGILKFFGMTYKDYAPQWAMFFDTMKSTKAYEEWVQQFGTGLAPVKAAGAPIAVDELGEVWKGRAEMSTFALSFAITREAVEDNQYEALVPKYTKALKRSMVITKEIRGAAYMEGMFSTNTTGDGVASFSAVHPLRNGETFSNLGTAADLNETSLEAALISIGDFVDERGLPISAKADKLTVPNALRFTAERLFATTMRPGTDSNDINAMTSLGMFPGGYCVNNYLTDPDAWYIKTDVPDGPVFFDRRPLDIGDLDGSETQVMRVYATERYTYANMDPRGSYGQPGV